MNAFRTERSVILITFAVAQEMHPFKRYADSLPACKLLVTGMGRRNAEATLSRTLADLTPSVVISSGFAGGLDPDLAVGQVVFDADEESGLSTSLEGTGAVRIRFA